MEKSIAPPKTSNSVLKNFKDVVNDPLNFFIKAARQDKITEVNIGVAKYYVTSDPDVLNQIFKMKNRNFLKSDDYKSISELVGNGLLTSEGEDWRKNRRLCQPAFSMKNLEHLITIMTRECEKYLGVIETKKGQEILMHEEMLNITLLILTKTLFNTSLNLDEIQAASDKFQIATEYIQNTGINPLMKVWYKINGKYSKFQKGVKWLDDLLFKLIDDRKKGGQEYFDLLGMLMKAEDPETGEGLSRKELRDEVMTFFFAGHETTANTLTWIFFMLAQKPEIKAKLKKEVEEVLNGRIATFEDIPKLVYTKKVILETLRMYPAVWASGRKTVEEDEILGYKIPAGANFMLVPYALHHDETYFEDPETFNPDRFTPEFYKKADSYSFIPFAYGPRKCIGDRFSIMESQMLLSALVAKFDFELIPGQKIKPVPVATLKPSGPVRMTVI